MRKSRIERSIGIKALAIALTLGSLSASALGWASETRHLPKLDASATKAAPASSHLTLGGLASFDVFGLEQASFSTERENVPPEIAEYARAALQTDNRFRYESPGQGVLRFECEDSGCDRIRAEVTQGPDGPVLWQTSKVFRHCPFIRFTFQPDSKKFAHKMVERLAQDYQNALKASATKIEIHQE